MKNLKPVFIGGIVVILIIIGVVFIKSNSEPGQYDDFAKCLTDNSVKMYGAYWCPYCLNQKEMFGKSWKYINYIECSLANKAGQTQECKQDGIKVYPTWEFQGGERIEGELSFEQISQYGSCKL